ncbi:MAG: hypothetical protein NVSMB1_05730 [Polyangiales bacterium]
MLLAGCGGAPTARMEKGVEFEGVTLPKEAIAGETIPIDFAFKASQPLEGEWWIFIHIESAGGQNCRVVFDRPPSDGPSATWKGQEVHHHVDVPLPSSCKKGRLEVFAGLYNRDTSARLQILEPPTLDNRLPAGFIDIVEGTDVGQRDARPRTISPSNMRLRGYATVLRPWTWWALCTFGAAVLCAILARWVRKLTEQNLGFSSAPDEFVPRWLRYCAYALPLIPLILGILLVLEFVKDDAYISFRYAHNLVTGKGLVFNPGDRLEGFTNFLWVLLLAPFEAMGWDLFQVCEVLGTVLSIAVLWQLTTFVAYFNAERRNLSHAWAAVWVATSSSWILWAKSGLEQPLAALLPMVSIYLLWRAQDDDRPRWGFYSGVVMGLGCMTRPEIHLIGAIVAVPLVIEAIARRRIDRIAILWVGGLLLITVPFHAFRIAYFHSLFPNTFYVKTGTHGSVWREGLKQLYEMFSFNELGILVVVSPFAFLRARILGGRLERKLVVLAIVLSFMAYIVKVGVDEMQWFRLYLPALPFLAMLAALGLQNICDSLFTLTKSKTVRTLSFAAGWGAVLYLSMENFRFTHKEMGGFNGHGDLSGMYHPDLGKFLTRHDHPGALVAFQDMGSTPYHAPDIDFLDFIGLVDGTVAHARHNYGLHAFISNDGQANQPIFDAEMRQYFYRRNPEWTILTVYTPHDEEARTAERFDHDPSPNAMYGAYAGNTYQFGIWNDPEFHRRYVHVRTWQRSRGYYLSLFRRRDLFEQTPGEVVLDALPPSLPGAKAKLENGLELLGSEVTGITLERHEVFITTWWRVPGPMPSDTTFFVHVNKPSGGAFQGSVDHLPGDSMYPADRFKPGQIIEDRVLFQLPITMTPGDYEVNMGVYRRTTFERAAVINGAPDQRIRVGTFHVNRLYPIVHQLIPPTKIDVQRKYPERIVGPSRR